MTQKALIECLATIDSHFGKQPSPEARRAEIQVYLSVLGNIPDEIALKALPAAFAVCRYQHQFIVDWSNAIKELQAAALPSASESWAQTRRIAKRMQDNLYHARYGGIMTHEGRITPYQLREENRRLFGELPPAIQAWAGSPDDLADLFNRPQSDLLQFVKPGFDRAVKESSMNTAIKKEQGALPEMQVEYSRALSASTGERRNE